MSTCLHAVMDMLPRLMNRTFNKNETYIWVGKSAALWNVWTKRSWLKWRMVTFFFFFFNFRVNSPQEGMCETNLQSREPRTPRWSVSIRSWSAERRAGLTGRGAGRPRRASWSRSRVGVEGSLWGRGNAPSVCSAPGNCPVDTFIRKQF